MLELTHTSLLREINAARDRTRTANKHVEQMIKLRRGPFYESNEGDLYGDPDNMRENYYHRWITFVVPQLVWGVPKVIFEDASDPEMAEDVKTLQVVCNQWGNDVEIDNDLRDGPATDMQYNYGAAYIDTEKLPWSENGEYQPVMRRIPQTRYIEDPVAMGRDEIRWQGHVFAKDRADCKEEDGWNKDVLATYAEDAHLEKLGRTPFGEGDAPKRNELVFYEVWMPEADPDQETLKEWGVEKKKKTGRGFESGWIFTLCALEGGGTGTGDMGTVGAEDVRRLEIIEWPRKPRQYYGPKCGPYVIFGAYTATNATLPTGPLQANEAEIRALNIDSNTAARMARSYKRILGLPAKAGEDDVTILRDSEHDGVVKFGNLISKDEVIQAEIGGLTDQVMAHVQEKRSVLEQNLGLSELHAGMAPRSGGVTATADSIADSAASVRFSGIEQGFLRGVREVYKRVAWYFWEDERMKRRLSPRSAEELDLEPGVPYEYVPPAGDAPPFESLSFRIDPYSIKRTSEQLQQYRAMQGMQVFMQVFPLMVQFPQYPWDTLLETWGDQLNIPGLEDFAKAAQGQPPQPMGQPGAMPGGPQSPAPMQAAESRGQGMPQMVGA